jgi:putative N6-adenine-specific DNA methylase
LLPFRPQLPAWRELQRQAAQRVHAPAAAVFAGDVSFRMTDFAARNAERAGVRQAIEFKTADALQRLPPAAAGTLMLNPPYGERIAPKGRGAGRDRVANRDGHAVTGITPVPAVAREGFEGGGSPAEFFGALAAHWKRHYSGWTAWLLSPEMKLGGLMRMKESRRVPMWNGAIECRLYRFDIVAGAGPGARVRPSAE